jgi:phospholipase/carboxylesterase
VPTERVLIAGFSQGGAIALAAALRHPQQLAGVIALSTYLPIAESTEKERSEANRGLPVFMALQRRLAQLRHAAFGERGGNRSAVGVAGNTVPGLRRAPCAC